MVQQALTRPRDRKEHPNEWYGRGHAHSFQLFAASSRFRCGQLPGADGSGYLSCPCALRMYRVGMTVCNAPRISASATSARATT